MALKKIARDKMLGNKIYALQKIIGGQRFLTVPHDVLDILDNPDSINLYEHQNGLLEIMPKDECNKRKEKDLQFICNINITTHVVGKVKRIVFPTRIVNEFGWQNPYFAYVLFSNDPVRVQLAKVHLYIDKH